MNEQTQPIGDLLTSTSPQMGDEDAAALATELYGMSVSVRRLTSERDANFLLVDAYGAGYVLKVANSAEPRANINFQTEALLHIERRDSALPVPRVVPASSGQTETLYTMNDGATCVVRILSYLEGEPLFRVESSVTQRRNLGQCLGRLGKALADFDHPAAGHDLLWDIKNAARLRTLVPSIADSDLRKVVQRHLDYFDSDLAPILKGLRTQVVHNDLNPHNVIVDPANVDTITGVLDFGDMVRTPLIIDLAVACSYQIGNEDHPLTRISDFVAAYHETYPLRSEEVDILFDLANIRLVTTIAITNWRAERYPENRSYILRNNQPAREGLARFETITRQQARQFLRRTCGLE